MIKKIIKIVVISSILVFTVAVCLEVQQSIKDEEVAKPLVRDIISGMGTDYILFRQYLSEKDVEDFIISGILNSPAWNQTELLLRGLGAEDPSLGIINAVWAEVR